MEVRESVCGFTSASNFPTPLTLPKPQYHLTPFSIKSCKSYVSFKTHLPIPPTTPKKGTFLRLRCTNRKLQVEAEARRKKLAVFVSGGGPNFRSIHEACVQGAVHGGVLVLVTNKQAFGGKGYYGMKVHTAVIASGARYSGPTIHFVDEHYDTGWIVAQRVVPVLANDTPEELAARVLLEEHRLYVEVTAALCDEHVSWREDGVSSNSE